MKSPRKPSDESARLEALRQYEVLDTLPEDAFDDLTELAGVICETPVSLISLVDDQRQWFKSKAGVTMSETPREVSFCGHAILQPDLFVVPDATKDERFADNPLVTGDPRICFYAGAPLVTPAGQPIGSLCVIDRVPRQLSPIQRQALQILAHQVMAQMELRRQTRQLTRNEERLRLVSENAHMGLVIVSRDRRYTYANATYAEIFGLPSPAIIGQLVAEVMAPAYEEQIRPRLDRAFAGERVTYELGKSVGGRDCYYSVKYEPTRINDRVELVVVVIADITEHKLQEMTALRLAAIVASSDDAIIGKDLNSIITSWNRSAERIFGYTAGEMVGTSIMRLIPPDRHEEEVQILTKIRRGDRINHFETKRVTKKGQLIDVSVTVSPIKDTAGKVIGVSKVARDITWQKIADLARRESDARYRTLFEYAPDGIVIADPTSVYLDANASICRMLGYTRDELIGLHASDIVIQEEVPNIEPALSAIKATSNYHREWRFRRKDGSVFAAEVIATAMPDGNLLGMIRDVTERKRTEARFRRLVDSNAQGVFFWNTQGGITGANDAFLQIMDYNREDLETGRLKWADMTPAEYAEVNRQARVEIVATGVCVPFEKEYVRKDGTRVSVLLGAAVFQDNPDEGVCFVVDLTKQKKLEQQFLRAQRMESIGTLAGGIAHDLNNLLAPITMGVGLLKIYEPSPRALPIIESIERSANRGANLVKQVLSFARGVEGSRVALQAGHIMVEVESIATNTFPKNIAIQVRVPKDLWLVTADPTQLNQVLLNLCVNARDAMPDGGRIELTANNVEIDEQYAVMNRSVTPGRFVLIQVTDTGSGMPKEIIDRIFEPFFTTKEIGKGTGLGLSTVLGIVRSHGGFVNVYSELGRGSTFKVYLPAQAEGTPAAPAGILEDKMPRGNGELILIVDDEASILDITKQTLETFGYRVVTAEDGAQAIGLYAMHRTEIAVVLTDMMMPVMDGPALIAALRRISPVVRIIAASGLNANGNVARAANAGVKHFLAKPYSADAMLTLLKTVLAEGAGRAAT